MDQENNGKRGGKCEEKYDNARKGTEEETTVGKWRERREMREKSGKEAGNERKAMKMRENTRKRKLIQEKTGNKKKI